MKTIKLTAEEIRMLGIQMDANPCSAGCPLDHWPRLPKKNGVYQCLEMNDNGEYICPLQRALWSIQEKLGLI